MSKKYLIRMGFTFIDHQGNGKEGGEIIELEDDVARLHLHKLEEVPLVVKKVPKPKTAVNDGAPPVVTEGAAEAADTASAAGATGDDSQPAGQPASNEE